MNAEKMDDTCVFLEWLIDWVNTQPVLPIIDAGTGMSWGNTPNPYLELVFIIEGHYDSVKCGPKISPLPYHHFGVTSVHFGNVGVTPVPVRSWCTFLDISDREEFAFLHERPLFLHGYVHQPRRMAEAFKTLAVRGKRSGMVLSTYPPPPEFLEWRKTQPVPPVIRALLKASYLEILGYMLEEAQTLPERDADLPPDSIRKAIEFLEVHYYDPDLTLKNIAEVAYLSEDHFGRLFSKHVGQSPMQYLRKIRIEHSSSLLRYSALSIGNIAREVGFSDPYYFSRSFRAVVGMSPRQYRLLEQEKTKSRTEAKN